MFAKLFARITESSLMEEEIPVRYTFVMLLAIADPTGHVIGTDVAIARRLNMPLEEFTRCVERLRQPDPDSNSEEEDGKRLLLSEGERGYLIVNYLAYRNMKDEQDKRVYMKEYMRRIRAKKQNPDGLLTSVKPVSSRKTLLTGVTQAEAEAEEEVHKSLSPTREGEQNPNHYEQREPVKPENGLRFQEQARVLLAVLNEATKSRYVENSKMLDPIARSLSEVAGDVEGCKLMIQRQVKLWAGDRTTAQGLRPATLFGEKFHEYYGQREKEIPNGNPNHQNGSAAAGRKRTIVEERNSFIIGAESTKRAILEELKNPRKQPWEEGYVPQ